MFYGVYYYSPSGFSTSVYLAGYYQTLNEAKERMQVLLPNYEPHYRNAVRSPINYRIGWVNQLEFGNVEYDGLSCCQPHNSVNLFTDQSQIPLQTPLTSQRTNEFSITIKTFNDVSI